jgi:hypothetical protein
MSSLLSAVTGTTGETDSNQGTERPQTTTGGSGGESGGSRRRNLALAAVGLGAAYFLRRRRAGKRRSESQGTTAATTGELDASKSASESSDGKRGRGVGGRVVRTVAGIAASVLVRRAIRRWRKR